MRIFVLFKTLLMCILMGGCEYIRRPGAFCTGFILRGDAWYGSCEFVDVPKCAYVYERQPTDDEIDNGQACGSTIIYDKGWNISMYCTNTCSKGIQEFVKQEGLIIFDKCVPTIHEPNDSYPAIGFVLHQNHLSGYRFYKTTDRNSGFVFNKDNSAFLPFRRILFSPHNTSIAQRSELQKVLAEYLGEESPFWSIQGQVISIWALNARRGIVITKLLSHEDFHIYQTSQECRMLKDFDIMDYLWTPLDNEILGQLKLSDGVHL